MDFINLNKRGRFGKIYKVVNKKKGSKLPSEMIAKVFRKNKNFEDIKQEYTIQKQIEYRHITPQMYSCKNDEVYGKYILMEPMEKTLYELLKESSISNKKFTHAPELSLYHQKRIYNILKILDKEKIFHNDPSPLNFMLKQGKIYIIDFGLSKKMTPEFIESHGKNANVQIGIKFLILKTRLVFKKFAPEYLMKKIKL